jgi:N6-adenosine-specific RNA methylase IME4
MIYLNCAHIPRKKYSCILADPPWTHRDKRRGHGGAADHYSTMTLDDLKAMPVGDIAAEDCLLAVCWVGTHPKEAISLVEHWGFNLHSMDGFVWQKTDSNGNPSFGCGGYTRKGGAESVLFALRGRPKVVNRAISHIIKAPRGKHSEKPKAINRALDLLLGDVPKIELFARDTFGFWDAFGNELRVECVSCGRRTSYDNIWHLTNIDYHGPVKLSDRATGYMCESCRLKIAESASCIGCGAEYDSDI